MTEQKRIQQKDFYHSWKKEMLGLYISGHPLEKLRNQIEQQATINTMQLRHQMDEQIDTQMTEKLCEFKDGQR